MAKKFVKLAILRIRHDPVGTPLPPEGACREILTTGIRSVLNYWEDVTHGYLSLATSEMFPWYDVSITAADAIIPDPNVPANAVVTRRKQAEIAVAAVRNANPGRDPLAGVDGIMVITLPGETFEVANPKAAQAGQPATLTVNFDGGASSYGGFPIAAIPVIPSSHTFACHELGHVLGLGHSYGLLNQGADWNKAPDHPEDDWLPKYGSPYDMMSGETFADTSGRSTPTFKNTYSPALSQAAGAPPEWPGPRWANMGPGLSCAHLYQNWPDAIDGRVVIRDFPQAGKTGGVRLRHAGSSHGNLALILRPPVGVGHLLFPGFDQVGTVVVEYRTNTDWDSGLDTSGADFARVGVVVHTLAVTSDDKVSVSDLRIRPWYRGNIRQGDVDTDMSLAGSGIVISAGLFDEDGESVYVSYRLGSSARVDLSSTAREDTVIGGDLQREEKTPCNTTVRYGHWPISTDESFEIRVAGMGSEDPRQSPIVIHWTVNGKAVPVGISNLPLLDAAGAMVSVTAQLDAGAAKLRLISPPGAKVSAIVSATATDVAGTTATDSIVFDSWGSVDGLHPDDYAVLVGCIADNIPGIPIDPNKFKRPSRDPQYLADLWMHEAFREVNKLEAHGLDAINVRNLRHLVNMQAVHPFG